MPPKAARGVGRGRGRGRGRGKAAAAEDVPPAPSPEPKLSDPESQSTVHDTPMIDAGPASITTPVHEQIGDQTDPNSSPATQPTETPAPTPVRVPPQSHMNAAALGSGTRGSEPTKLSRFKPRIARTNAKEREEREAREREKENARLGAIAYAAQSSRGWGRGRVGRGRGAAMGRGRVQPGAASGPFAEVASSGVRKGLFNSAPKVEGGPALPRNAAENPHNHSGKPREERFKTEPSNANSNSVSRVRQPEPQYPHDNDDIPRVDIEHINDSSDSDDDVIITGVRTNLNGKERASQKGGLKPIRLDRKEHKPRSTIVNTDVVIKPDPENADLDEMVIDEGRSSKVTSKPRRSTNDDGVKIKSEPGIIPQMRYTRQPTESSPPPSESRVPGDIEEPDNSGTEYEDARLGGLSQDPERKARPRASRKKNVDTPVIQTEEDRAEWARHLEDVEILRQELGGMAASIRPEIKGKDNEGDIDMEGTAPEALKHTITDGRVYLFQFPPVLPKLFNEQTSSNPNFDAVEMMAPIDLTREDKEIKSEEVIEVKQEELDENELRRRRERDKLVINEGQIGKLVLRESGKVQMVWGGTNMNVGRGIETSFCSVGAVVDGLFYWQNDGNGNDISTNHGKRGKSMDMGEIMGKFVVTPDWSRIR